MVFFLWVMTNYIEKYENISYYLRQTILNDKKSVLISARA
jgi:hypothetical protein